MTSDLGGLQISLHGEGGQHRSAPAEQVIPGEFFVSHPVRLSPITATTLLLPITGRPAEGTKKPLFSRHLPLSLQAIYSP